MDDKNLHTNQIEHQNYPDPDIPADEAWAGMKQLLINNPVKINPGKSVISHTSNFFVYAGMSLIFISIIVYYFVRKKSQDQTAAITYYSQNQPRKDTLSNGTVVFLDRYSSISEITKKDKEDLITIKGAAYFEAGKINNQLPHHLRIGSLDVLPVKANIYLSFDSASGVSLVHIQSGTALIETKGEKLTLTSGESIEYDEKSGHMKDKQRVDVNLFSYATRIFEFSDTPLKAAAESIENAYGVTIVFENTKLYNCRITTRFDNKSLKEILDIMAYTLNFDYHLDEKNNRVLLTGNGCE